MIYTLLELIAITNTIEQIEISFEFHLIFIS